VYSGVKPFAVSLFQEHEMFGDFSGLAVSHHGSGNRIGSARGRAVRIHGASFIGDKRALKSIILFLPESDHRKAGFRSGMLSGVPLQKIICGYSHVVFEAKNIIRGQKLIKVTAAFIKTRYVRPAGKLKGIV